MRTVPEPPKIEPVCLSNGPKVVMSLAVPRPRPLLRQVCYMFLFLLAYKFTQKARRSLEGGVFPPF